MISVDPLSSAHSWGDETEFERDVKEMELSQGPLTTRFGYHPGPDFRPIFTPLTEVPGREKLCQICEMGRN